MIVQKNIMLSDVTRNMPFEINPAFFPPPTISIPSEDIKPPSDFRYDFTRENEAIAEYSKEQNGSGGDVAGTIDILSKMAYLSLSKSKPNKSQPNNNQSPSPPSTPQAIAAGMLPTWKPPSLL
uniref:UMA domain-containing protein n=1 Tax=Panagrellus redivivus TaxID=6233 RepID=A0A7E4VAR1_PANRE